MTNTKNNKIPNVDALLATMCEEIKTLLKPNVALVGIQSGGALILKKLLVLLADEINTNKIEFGMLDVSMHRDDYATSGLKAEIQPTKITFDVQDKHIILIDDVFNTGRTTRAAMNELFDFGRPASITLAALVNRGGRELPIQPQITSFETILAEEEYLQLSEKADGTLMLKCNNMKAPRATK